MVYDLTTAPNFVVIIRAMHLRGAGQAAALVELERRRLWLSPDQRKTAGLSPEGSQ